GPRLSRVVGESFAVSWMPWWVISEPSLPSPAASWVTALFLGHQTTGTRAAPNRTAATIDRYQPRPGPTTWSRSRPYSQPRSDFRTFPRTIGRAREGRRDRGRRRTHPVARGRPLSERVRRGGPRR